MSFNLQDAVKQAAAQSQDMNVATKGGGGGDYTPPAAGLVRLRFVGYIEMGKHEGQYQGKPKINEKAWLVFELSGPKHEPRKLEDGTEVPQRITVKLNKSLSEKAGFYKLFKAMNYDGKAKIMAELLGNAYLGNIFHREFDKKGGGKGIEADLVDPNTKAFTVRAPLVEDPETGETKRVKVSDPLTEPKCFLWDFPSKAMWDSIYIDGEYPERKDEKTGEVIAPAKSKNVFQNAIMTAKNWQGSPMQALLEGEVDIGGADTPAKAKAAAKPEPAPQDEPVDGSPAEDEDDPLAQF